MSSFVRRKLMKRKILAAAIALAAFTQAVPASAIHGGIVIKPNIASEGPTIWHWFLGMLGHPRSI
jgi:hypothetical protein